MASITDKITDIRNAARPNSARVTSGRSAAGATLACDNLSGWPTASKVHFVTYKIDSSSDVVAGSQLDCYGIVSGNNIGSFTVVDGTDTGHAVGDVVEMLPTAAWGQDLADALSVGHTRTGAHAANLPLTTPAIGDFSNATHTHANNAGGGQLTGSSALVASTVTADSVASGFPVQMVQTDYSADTTGSTVIPADDTIPQITEGFEVMTQAITPKATNNSLIVQATVLLAGNSASRSLSAAIFQDATANALAATTQFQAQSSGDVVLTLSCKVTATSIASTTFRVRIGSDNGGTTVTFGNSRFSTAIHSHIRVTEVKA